MAASALVSAFTAALAFSRRHKVPAALAFASIPLSHALWTALNLGEVLAPTVDGKLLFDALQWLPGLGVAVGSLWFAYEYAGQSARPALWWALLLIPLPAIAIEIVAPRWVHPDAFVRYDQVVATLDYPFSWLDWMLTSYGFLPIIAASALVARRLVHDYAAQLPQVLIVFVGLTLPPIAAIVAVAFQVRVLGQVDPTPLVFGLADLIVAYGLFRTRLFDLAPVAREVLVAGLADGIVVCDHAGRIVDANRALEAALGVAPCHVLGRDASTVFARWPTLVAACEGASTRAELEVVQGAAGSSDGCRVSRVHGTRWLDITATTLRDRHGHVLGRALVLRDVTDRQQAQRALARAAERALRDSQQRFRAIIDHTFELIGLLDAHGNLLVANRTALDFAGLNEAEEAAIRGRPYWETPWWAHSEELRDKVRAAVTAVRQGTFVRFEATHINRNGEPRSIDFSLKAVRGQQGNGGDGQGDGRGDSDGDTSDVALLIAEGRDVTELRHAERENVALEERLHRARRLESIGRLAGGVAHDFNNLITAILGSVEVARMALPLESEAAPALEVIERAAASAAQLTRRLLAVGRRQTRAPEIVDLGAYLDAIQPLLARVLGTGIAVSVRATPGIWPVRLDTTQMEQIFLNLAANARDAMPRGGRLTIAAENVMSEPPADAGIALRAPAHHDAAAYVQLHFVDTGTGMSDVVLERIFEPFYTTKDLGKGTGLGLAVVYGIVRQSGGSIEVSSRPGEGSSFRLLFPRAEPLMVAVDHEPPAAAPAAPLL